MNEPLFPSYEEMNRRLNAAKQLRIDFLHRIARNAKRKFAAQSRTVRRVEASAALLWPLRSGASGWCSCPLRR